MPFLLRSKVRSGRALALCAAAALAGCGDAVPLDTTVGPFAYEVDLARITLPEPWRAGAILPGIACQSAAPCPSLGTSGPTVRCNNNLYDPDPSGFDPAVARYAVVGARWMYRHWFRVEVEGMEHVPDGRLLLIANHSGQLPFDAMAIACALLLDRDPPRFVRSMVDKWTATLPFVSTRS